MTDERTVWTDETRGDVKVIVDVLMERFQQHVLLESEDLLDRLPPGSRLECRITLGESAGDEFRPSESVLPGPQKYTSFCYAHPPLPEDPDDLEQRESPSS